MCILGHNLMNQKIYLVLWVWFMVIFCLLTCSSINRCCSLFAPGFRRMMIQSHVKSRLNKAKDSAINELKLDYEYLGHWFLLVQIGRNTTPYTFRLFLDEVVGKKQKNPEEKECSSYNLSKVV